MRVPDSPLFSVVIPTFNCAPYVAQAIESALGQTVGRASLEVIVLDDGSSDGTADVVRAFGDAVRFERLPHGGVSRARNAGIAAARGQYVAFLDADDYWFEQRLERAAALLGSEARIFVNTEYFIETAGARAPQPYYKSRGLRCLFELPAAAQLEFSLEDNFISSMAIAPRAALLDAGGFSPHLRYGEDWDLWLRMLGAGYAVRLVDEPSAVYRYHRPGATTTHNSAAKARDRLAVLSQYREIVSEYRWEQAHQMLRRLTLREKLRRFVPRPA